MDIFSNLIDNKSQTTVDFEAICVVPHSRYTNADDKPFDIIEVNSVGDLLAAVTHVSSAGKMKVISFGPDSAILATVVAEHAETLFNFTPVVLTGLPDTEEDDTFDRTFWDRNKASVSSIMVELAVARANAMATKSESTIFEKEQKANTRSDGTMKKFDKFDPVDPRNVFGRADDDDGFSSDDQEN